MAKNSELVKTPAPQDILTSAEAQLRLKLLADLRQLGFRAFYQETGPDTKANASPWDSELDLLLIRRISEAALKTKTDFEFRPDPQDSRPTIDCLVRIPNTTIWEAVMRVRATSPTTYAVFSEDPRGHYDEMYINWAEGIRTGSRFYNVSLHGSRQYQGPADLYDSEEFDWIEISITKYFDWLVKRKYRKQVKIKVLKPRTEAGNPQDNRLTVTNPDTQLGHFQRIVNALTQRG